MTDDITTQPLTGCRSCDEGPTYCTEHFADALGTALPVLDFLQAAYLDALLSVDDDTDWHEAAAHSRRTTAERNAR